ncbi:hypothetical protein GCM10022204_07570 [Microlunatus aurantiacus]|uniref:HPt domain-containing protein n=1 Tax=Microlunatus aurantiacus TaxID=446786 RepID=A0ABP7CUX0_9ACTN
MTDHGSTGAGSRPVPSDDFAAVLSTIASQARRTNLVRVLELTAALDRVADEQLDPAGWAAAERTAHQLAGSAGTFGFDGVTVLARSLERFLAETRTAGAAEPDRLAAARRQLDRAGEQLAAGPAPD